MVLVAIDWTRGKIKDHSFEEMTLPAEFKIQDGVTFLYIEDSMLKEKRS